MYILLNIFVHCSSSKDSLPVVALKQSEDFKMNFHKDESIPPLPIEGGFVWDESEDNNKDASNDQQDQDQVQEDEVRYIYLHTCTCT